MHKMKIPETNNIGKEEKAAVMKVLDSGNLSGFIGRAGKFHLGGPMIRKLEKQYERKYKVKYAVAFNSATTALSTAVGALGLPEDFRVITTPYTMSATAMAIEENKLHTDFVDIDKDTFCIDPKKIEEKITQWTKAIVVVNLFGGSAEWVQIKRIAKKHKLKIIEDNAQSPGGTYKGQPLGTMGDIGVFSLNQHKTVHCGEGGILVTDNEKYADFARLRRNHAESINDDLNTISRIVGSNFRMTEIEAAIAYEQTKKLTFLNRERIKLAKYLTKQLEKISGLTPPKALPDSKHVYFVYPFKYNQAVIGRSRVWFAEEMAKLGFPLGQGYVKPINLMSFYKSTQGFPELDECPVAKRMWKTELLTTSICRYPVEKKHIDAFMVAIHKVLAKIR